MACGNLVTKEGEAFLICHPLALDASLGRQKQPRALGMLCQAVPGVTGLHMQDGFIWSDQKAEWKLYVTQAVLKVGPESPEVGIWM